MMRRLKKLPGSGDEEYSMRNVPSMCKSMEQYTSPSLFPRPRDGNEYQPSPWSCPSGRQPFPYPITEGLPVTHQLLHRPLIKWRRDSANSREGISQQGSRRMPVLSNSVTAIDSN